LAREFSSLTRRLQLFGLYCIIALAFYVSPSLDAGKAVKIVS